MNAKKLYAEISKNIQIQPRALFVVDSEAKYGSDKIFRLCGYSIEPAKNQKLDAREVLSYTICSAETLQKCFSEKVANAGAPLMRDNCQLLIIGVTEYTQGR